ncbi:MAG: DoxX family protein [Bacteroidota bacterium]
MNEKTKKIIGWVLGGLIAAILSLSAIGKLSGAAGPMLSHFGFTENEILMIGIGELISAILFLIPKTQSLGTLLLSAYMGGAIVAHMGASVAPEELGGESVQDYTAPSILLIVIWGISFFRNPKVFSSFTD